MIKESVVVIGVLKWKDLVVNESIDALDVCLQVGR